jgi:hypothetical protein
VPTCLLWVIRDRLEPHNAGVSVLIPAPERYAVHKLIIATRRRNGLLGVAKGDKDIRQASALFKAMIETRRRADLATAFTEAWDRGPAWKQVIRHGLSRLEVATRAAVDAGLAEGVDSMLSVQRA